MTPKTVAEILARTAELLDRATERLEMLDKEIFTPERLAQVLGYDKVESLERDAREHGWRRHKLSRVRWVYLRSEILEDLRRLEG